MAEPSVLTPSSITTYWESPFAAWMDLWSGARARDGALSDPWAHVGGSRRDEQTEEARLLATRGREHEASVFARLAATRDVRRIDPHDRDATLAAMRAGAGVIYQASLASDGLAGVADFLVRVEKPSALGAHAYAVWDAKLAHAPKPEFVLQVCAYVEMLDDVQQWIPDRCTIALGQGAEWEFAPREFLAYYRTVRRLAEAFHGRFDPCDPVHPRECVRFGSWSGLAARVLEAEDHVSGVANITRSQVRRLEDAGLSTVTDLAHATDGLRGMDPAVYARLRAQAAMQVASRGAERPAYRVQPLPPDDPRRGLGLLPPPSPLDVFFDMEGDPLTTGGYEYLFGACVRADGAIAFHDWWAYTTGEEQRAFEGFIDWTMDRWRRDPAMHVYHYAPYEVTAVRRLSTRYGTREAEVDELLRHHVFVDLYQVVRQGLVVGTANYSLKSIEKLYLAREGDITSAGASVVAFNRWRDAPDGGTWEESPTLRSIRDYNRVDCESLVHLVDWLGGVQREAGVAFAPPHDKRDDDDDAPSDQSDRARLRADLVARLTARATDDARDPAERRVDQLLAWLVEFHWREKKPLYWEMYAKQERSEDENYDDPDCLICERTDAAPVPVGRGSLLYEFRFHPDQDTLLDEGMSCSFVHDLSGAGRIESIDRDQGRVTLRRRATSEPPPACVTLFERNDRRTEVIEDAIARYATARTGRAIDDLLARRAPRLRAHRQGDPLAIDGDAHSVARVTDLVRRMDETTLCIQGPPGTGKTYTASHVIDALLSDGRRIGVMSNSHKAIVNLMIAVAKVPRRTRARVIKVGDDAPDPRFAEHGIEWVKDSRVAETMLDSLEHEPCVMGGTAWFFSREPVAQRFDYLFVDEAGQVALANIVAAGQAARNIVLVGDQMQLAQPTRGAHPGESGQSALEYLLHGADTIPPDMGVFLDTSWRMHPDVCAFVSETMYDGRLRAHARTAAHAVIPGRRPARRVTRSAGIVFAESAHTGNAQWSAEEIVVVRDVLGDLNAGRVQDEKRKAARIQAEDILVVAPYNAQVRRLRQSVGAGARVGTVDKFQGQEAPVVIVSLAASTIEEAPRGAEFLLSRNRINVAISRAEALAVVVASPALLTAHCASIEDMRRVNLLCRLHDLGSSATLSQRTPADPAVTLFRSTS